MKYFANPVKRARRRAWPIHAYVGPNGGGKSAAMVWDTLPSLEAGRPVLSTVRLLDYRDPRPCADPVCEALATETGHFQIVVTESGRAAEAFNRQEVALFGEQAMLQPVETEVVGVHQAAHPAWVPLKRWEQLLDARGCDVLLDEVTGVASSRESASLPAPVANKLVQLRRADVVVRWSAPAWGRSDLIIRECTQAVTDCRGYLAKAGPRGADGEERLWRQRRLFKWRTYDATLFEDFTAGKREELPRMVSDLHWGPGSIVFGAYDTYDSVESIVTVTEGGSCYRCGGRRSRPACKCSSHGATEEAPESPGPRSRGGRRVRTETPDETPSIGAGS